jgi:uncharacterized protein YceK
MKSMWIPAPVAICLATLTGCGTVRNFAGGAPEVYGGVKKDVEFVMTPGPGLTYTSGTGTRIGVGVLALGLMLADISLSFVADTLTLPVITYRERKQDAGDEWVGRDDPDRPAQFSAGGFDPNSPPPPPSIATSPAAE